MAPSFPVRVSAEYAAENPDADPTATEVVINAISTGTALLDALEGVLRPHGLTSGSFNLLTIVAGADGPLTPTEIARRSITKVTTATVTGLLDTCQRNGLVQRRKHPDDGRRVLIHVTPAGRALLRAVNEDVAVAERRWVGPLSASRRETLVRALGELRNALDASG